MSTYGEVAKNNTLFTKGTQIAHSILDFFYLTFAAIGDEMFQKKKKNRKSIVLHKKWRILGTKLTYISPFLSSWKNRYVS